APVEQRHADIRARTASTTASARPRSRRIVSSACSSSRTSAASVSDARFASMFSSAVWSAPRAAPAAAPASLITFWFASGTARAASGRARRGWGGGAGQCGGDGERGWDRSGALGGLGRGRLRRAVGGNPRRERVGVLRREQRRLLPELVGSLPHLGHRRLVLR